jgi:uncharacterized membrane protein YsdA (DUF1294 family)
VGALAQPIREHPIYILWGWLVIVNLAAFLTMGADKLLAVKEKRRVPERRLFQLAVFGGSAGGILGMLCFRHKIRNRRFSLGFPLILLLQTVLLLFLTLHER